MPIKTKVESIEKDIALIFKEELSPEARSRTLAKFARNELAEAQRINQRVFGTVPDHETYVDGRLGAAPENVKPDGIIIFEFELVEDVLVWIGEMLVRHSPYLTGRYTASHALFADNVLIDVHAPIPPASTYQFVNTQPYARKIERGLSPQAPDGVYEAVATMARRRFGNIAKVRFGYESPLTGAIHEWAKTTSLTGKGRQMSSRTRDEWLRRQPAIIVTPN